MPRTPAASLRLLLVSAALVTAGPREVRADDTHECVVASNDGQVLRDAQKLVEARDKFVQCSRKVCPAVVRDACIRWRVDLEPQVPTLVLAAHDPAGRDLLPVRVFVDGALVLEKLDGSPLAVDPGPRHLRFEAVGSPPLEQDVVVHAGEKNRLLSVEIATDVAPSAPTTSTPPSRPLLPTASWILGGVGVAALGSFAAFGAIGLSNKNHLQGVCAGPETCAPGDVSTMKAELVVADVSLGLGVVALAASVYFAVSARSEPPVAVGLSPTRSGALATWETKF
jgi:hypothetical protein